MKESEHEVPAILKFARMLYRSCIYLDLKPDELSIKFASDVMDLAEEYYNNKEYDRAIAMAKESLQIKDGFYKAHSILVRSYIQKEMWTEFENAFIGFRSVAQPKDIHYFLGFKARKEGNIDTAIREYATAIDFRYTGFPIYRELAQCHLARGDYFEAEKNVKIAISKKPENKYVVDMHAKIAALLGKSKDAFDALEVLQIVDSQENYFHRKSTVMLLLGDVDGALESALKAISFSNDTPRFEVIAQALHCYIRKNDFTQADYYYNKLKSLYPKKKLDVQNALRCKMSLITHNTAEAIEYYSRIINKSTKHASQLLYEIANNSLTDPNLGVEDKEKYSKIIESFSLDKKIDFISSEF
jgi:tetratricopeptide (TPR) repeat protein